VGFASVAAKKNPTPFSPKKGWKRRSHVQSVDLVIADIAGHHHGRRRRVIRDA
jgi:hypothetical protein